MSKHQKDQHDRSKLFILLFRANSLTVSFICAMEQGINGKTLSGPCDSPAVSLKFLLNCSQLLLFFFVAEKSLEFIEKKNIIIRTTGDMMPIVPNY